MTHVLVDQDKKVFTVRSFNHGWRNGSGDQLASAFWKHFEQELCSQGLPLEAILIPPDIIAPGLPDPETEIVFVDSSE